MSTRRSKRRPLQPKQQEQLHSDAHSGRPCNSTCTLCDQKGTIKYTHPNTWRDTKSLDSLKVLEPLKHLQIDSCICRLCRDDVPKVLSNPDYTPRWRKIANKHKHRCSVHGCTAEAEIQTKESLDKLSKVLDLDMDLTSSYTNTTPLCKDHHRKMYKQLHPTHFIFHCKTCKNILSGSKTRKCPNPGLVTKYLVENSQLDEDISPDDHICDTCYRAQLIILKQLNNTMCSKDEDLVHLLNNLKEAIPNMGDLCTLDEVINYSVMVTAANVGNELLEQRAVLLPAVYDEFIAEVNRIAKLRNIPITVDLATDYATSRWLRSQLSNLLDFHIAYQCKIRKYGVVLHRYGGDIIHSLNVALGQLRHLQRLEKRECTVESMTVQENTEQSTITNACTLLNEKVHDCIKQQISSDAKMPHDITSLDVDDFIKSIDPALWRAICLLTKPKTSKADNNSTRKMRRFFCLCMMLFCTNSECSFPAHTLMTDIIESCGGSQRLIRILNRLGVCASIETHRRYIQYQVQKLRKEDPMKDCPEDTLTIFSADNLDFIHSFSRVYCGKQESSWHGTTVQAIQPQPTVTIRKDAPERETEHVEAMPMPSGTCTHTSQGVLDIEFESQSSSLHSFKGVLNVETDPTEVLPQSPLTYTSEDVLGIESEPQLSPPPIQQTCEGVLNIVSDLGPMEVMPQSPLTYTSEGVLDIESEPQLSPSPIQQTCEGVLNIEPDPMEVIPESPLTYVTDGEFKTVGEVTSNEMITTERTSDRHPTVPPTGTSEMHLRSRLAKRPHSCLLSPNKCGSPTLLTRKKQRRMRTGTEGTNRSTIVLNNSPNCTTPCSNASRQKPKLSITQFKLTDSELKELQSHRMLIHSYMAKKVAYSSQDQTIIDLPSYFALYNDMKPPEMSNVVYLSVLDQKADNKETLLGIINQLHETFITKMKNDCVILEGDAATYELLQCIKMEYGSDMSWLVPFPGDWHTLKNFQEVLLKVYFDGGLRDLAKASGYNPNAIGRNFKRTHNFLMEAWEAMYRHFLTLFHDSNDKGSQEHLRDWLNSFPKSLNQQQCNRNLKELISDLQEKFPEREQHFQEFLDNLSSKDSTWKFWQQFVFQDCFAYVSLYMAIRTGRWNLRMSAYKSMAALFTAYDRPTYEKLISQHISDMDDLPQPILEALRNGGFIVSLKGRPCHSVGIDEAHEMCINKDCKECITKPSADYINRIAQFLPVRSKAMKNLENQIFPEIKKGNTNDIKGIFTKAPQVMKYELNVCSQLKALADKSVLNTTHQSTDLLHLFTGKNVTPEQQHDLLNFRQIGQKEFENRVEYFILKLPSVKLCRRRKRLLTFSERKSRVKKVSEIEKERKLQLECWKKRVAFASKMGLPISNTYEQCIELPRAIATAKGDLVKGTKANATKVYVKRYERALEQIIRTSYPPGWVPEVVIVEGMFLINISPWGGHSTMSDYAAFLKNQHINKHFRCGAKEVHVIFDDPGSLPCSPKQFDRDKQSSNTRHTCIHFTGDTPIPKRWREDVLQCRQCKRNLVVFLSQYFLASMSSLLPTQTFITAGGFEGCDRHKAYRVQADGVPQLCPLLTCNAEETDTRLWLHIKHSAGQRKLVLSPDTDIYHIGLPLVANTELDVLVKISPLNSREFRLLDMQALIEALTTDPDLTTIPRLSILYSIGNPSDIHMHWM